MLTVVATEYVGLSQKSENAIVYTIIVFAAVIIGLRPAWGRKAFRRGLALTFLLHLLGVGIVFYVLPSGREGLHGLPLVIAAMIEALLLAGVLWKRARKSLPLSDT